MEIDLVRTMTVDYQRLSEIYAGFLVAVGSVSITVITLILILPPSQKTEDSKEKWVVTRRMKHMRISRTFVVTALLVATVSCFIGAHMMAETSASISYSNEELKETREKNSWKRAENPGTPTQKPLRERKSSGERLFLLASSNIFIATILVLFALMLIPGVTGRTSILRVREISFKIFFLVTLSIMFWMALVVLYRMPTKYSVLILILAVLSLLASFDLYFLTRKNIFYFFIRKNIFYFLTRKNTFYFSIRKHIFYFLTRKNTSYFSIRKNTFYCPIRKHIFNFLIRKKIFYFLNRKNTFYCPIRKHIFYFFIRKNIHLGLNGVFLPIVVFTAFLLGYFACFFDDGGVTTPFDQFLFCSGVSVSYGFILAAGLKIGWLDLRKRHLKQLTRKSRSAKRKM